MGADEVDAGQSSIPSVQSGNVGGGTGEKNSKIHARNSLNLYAEEKVLFIILITIHPAFTCHDNDIRSNKEFLLIIFSLVITSKCLPAWCPKECTLA